MNKQKSAFKRYFSRLFLPGLIALAAVVFSAIWFRSAPVLAQQDEFSPSVVVFSENFDAVTAPALPAGWTTSRAGDIDVFTTISTFPDSSPNAVFVHDPNTEGTAELVSPSIALGNIQHKITFRHFYQTDFEFDGGVLEISIAGGAFVDIISAGGVFVSGAYDTPLLGGSSLAGRRAWTGQQAGYITTEVTLPPTTNNQNVRFRWRLGTDPMEAGTGWRIDNIVVSNAISGTNFSAISIPAVGQAAPYPSQINVANHDGFVTGVQVSLTNFSHASPDDVDLVLAAPNGRKVVLMSDVGGTNPVTNLNLFFTDAAAASLPDSALMTSGNYKPTNFETGDNFPLPAPNGSPTGARLSAFNGSAANGTWELFLVDDNGTNAGSISGGWTLFVQSSPDAIAIPDSGTAQPYGSDKTITGLLGTVTKATVTLSNFSHTSPDDVDVLLVAPNGKRIVLMSDIGGNTEIGGLNFTFDDNAASGLPDNSALVSGTFKPTDFEPGDVFPAPAPQGAVSGTTLNAFYGSAPNGLWKLFVVDDNGSNVGSAGSWSISLQTSTTACAFTLSPIAQAFPITGGSGNFGINMPANCSWSASTNANFININSSANGTGAGAINFSVATNMSGAREGFIEITNGVISRTFQVQQPSGCPFSLNQTAMNVGSAGGSGNVEVTAGSVCSWQATSGANWIQITSAQQTGNGTASFTVSANPSANARSATVTIGARSVTVNQAGASARRFDFDGDGKSDVSVYRPSTGTWYLLNSGQQGSYSAIQFGLSTDKLAPGDFDGDRKTDVTVFRPSEGRWYIFQSQTNTVRIESWGLSTDTPMPGDYDGDGKSDLAIYRSSDATWYIRRSTDSAYQAVQFGMANDKPMSGDFDGDGRVDFALYRAGAIGSPSNWAILNSGNGQSSLQQFGNGGDVALTGDFDGDGRDNMVVFRPSTGTWYTSTNPNTNYGAQGWGIAGDVPAAGDYNGDGRSDFVVYRPSTGVWYLLHSNDQTIRTEFWGLDTDLVVPGSFNAQ